MDWLIIAALAVVIVVAVILVASHYYLKGEDLSRYDMPIDSSSTDAPASAAHGTVLESMAELSVVFTSDRPKERLANVRRYFDEMGDNVEFDGDIIPIDTPKVKGEWVVAPGADSRRRILYIHGGGWIAGSPLSHRMITTTYSRLTGCAVFAVKYRLLPEHKRIDCINDCREAYRWVLQYSPSGEDEEVSDVYVSGDSAGGNMSLSLAAWIRDVGLPFPNAVVALSPATDATFGSPSIQRNKHSDPMLGPGFGVLGRIPKSLLLLGVWFFKRIKPNDALVSPVMGDLSGLPPILIHASEAEMLHDDALRYVNKAREQGSPVTLQTWPHMVHVWHIFGHELPEAKHAFDEIGEYIREKSRC